MSRNDRRRAAAPALIAVGCLTLTAWGPRRSDAQIAHDNALALSGTGNGVGTAAGTQSQGGVGAAQGAGTSAATGGAGARGGGGRHWRLWGRGRRQRCRRQRRVRRGGGRRLRRLV